MTWHALLSNDIAHTLAGLQTLAQTTRPAGTQDPPWWANNGIMLYVVLGAGLLFMFTSSSKQRKNEKRERESMLSNLKRGDRVQTIGGIFGSVVESRENEVVVKIDESTNTKIRVSRDAIKTVTREDPDAATK